MPAHRRSVTDALLVMLRAQTTADARPLRIGDHRAPQAPAGEKLPETPFAVLKYIGGPELTGPPFGDRHADGRHDFQLTSVGNNRRSAEALADAIRDAILARGSTGFLRAITPEDSTVIDRELLTAAPATPEGAWVNAVDQFSIWTTSE